MEERKKEKQMSNTKYINSEKNRKHERMSWKPDIGKWKTKRKMKIVVEIAEKVPMVGAGAIAGLGGYAAYELMKLKKFQNQQDALRRAAHMERFEIARNARSSGRPAGSTTSTSSRGGGGGGGGGIFTQPGVGHGLMNIGRRGAEKHRNKLL